MAMQHQAMFESPATHEATHYSNPYSNPEFEDEWETSHEAAHYSNPEFEDEWEATHYGNPESEWETSHEATHYSNPYSNPEFEDEWEATHYGNPESEWETSHEATHYSNPYSNPEFEDEGEYFFKKAFRSIGRGLASVAKAAAPIAKRFAPIIAGKLATMIPGLGVIAGPMASKLMTALVREGEMEAAQLEAEFFGTNEAEAEVGHTEAAHEAALTEFLAAQSAEAATEAEAESTLGSALPITITIMGGRRALRPVMPALAQANSQIVKMLRQQGPIGRELLRTVPTIQRRAISTLKAASRSGQPINSPLAIKAMAAASSRVLGNPQTVQRAIVRNAVLRQRTAPPNPRRQAATAAQCPACAARSAR